MQDVYLAARIVDSIMVLKMFKYLICYVVQDVYLPLMIKLFIIMYK